MQQVQIKTNRSGWGYYILIFKTLRSALPTSNLCNRTIYCTTELSLFVLVNIRTRDSEPSRVHETHHSFVELAGHGLPFELGKREG